MRKPIEPRPRQKDLGRHDEAQWAIKERRRQASLAIPGRQAGRTYCRQERADIFASLGLSAKPGRELAWD